MKKLSIRLLVIFLLNLCSGTLFAQYTFFKPKESFAIEVSLPNSALTRLPMYRNAISSLIVVDDFIVGGTSAKEGLAPFVFVASISERKLINYKDLNEVIPGQRSIQSGYSRGKNKMLFAGTIANESNNGAQGDGHLIQIKINQQGMPDIQDLGVPVPGEGVLSLVSNAQGTMLYGVSYPSGQFFTYNIETKDVQTYDDITPTKRDLGVLEEFALKPENYLCKALTRDDQGIIYGSMPINKIFAFNPKDDSFQILNDALPKVWGRRAMGQIESWAKAEDGKLYGGSAGDGQLFLLDPATKKVKNMGKPIMMNRLRGLTFGKDGKLYGIAGALPGYTHLFSYDEDGEGYQDLGNPQFKMVAPGIEQGISWRGFQLGTIASSEDGKYIVMGEDEALSQLLIFAVGENNEQRRSN